MYQQSGNMNMYNPPSAHPHHRCMHWECSEHKECPRTHFRRFTMTVAW